MAFIQCDFFSEVLGLSCSMNVVLPQRTVGQIGMEGQVREGKFPVLWLLHGLSDDHTIWMRRTSIERYVASLGLAVIMPAVNRSFYVDAVNGPAYHTFIAEELPKIARGFFPLSDAREDNFVAGLSMGGYGAFLLALRHPERYSFAASLSGVLNIASLHERFASESPMRMQEYLQWFGGPEKVAGSDWDLFALMKKHVKTGIPLPKLYSVCGTEDFLYSDHCEFRDLCKGLDFPLDAEQAPGAHEWSFWDVMIQRALKRLPLEGTSVEAAPRSREEILRKISRK